MKYLYLLLDDIFIYPSLEYYIQKSSTSFKIMEGGIYSFIEGRANGKSDSRIYMFLGGGREKCPVMRRRRRSPCHDQVVWKSSSVLNH